MVEVEEANSRLVVQAAAVLAVKAASSRLAALEAAATVAEVVSAAVVEAEEEMVQVVEVSSRPVALAGAAEVEDEASSPPEELVAVEKKIRSLSGYAAWWRAHSMSRCHAEHW